MKSKSLAVHHIFVNRRPTKCLQIHNFILETINNLRNQLQIPPSQDIYFLLYIECSFSDYIFSSFAGNSFVIFKNCQKILNAIKICIMNSILLDSNKFMKEQRSKVQEGLFQLRKNCRFYNL